MRQARACWLQTACNKDQMQGPVGFAYILWNNITRLSHPGVVMMACSRVDAPPCPNIETHTVRVQLLRYPTSEWS